MVRKIILFCCCSFVCLFSCTSKERSAEKKQAAFTPKGNNKISTRIIPPSANAPFRNITPAEGLPTISVSDITQDTLGFIWIASWDGVYRYDGNTFQKISENGRMVVADKKGGVWIPTGNAGRRILYFDPRGDTLRTYGNLKMIDRYPYLALDVAGGVWISTNKGVGHLDEQTDSFRVEKKQQPGTVGVISARGNGELLFKFTTTATIPLMGFRDSLGKFTYEPYPADRNNPAKDKLFSDVKFELLPYGSKGVLLVNRFGWAYRNSPDEQWIFNRLSEGERTADSLRIGSALLDRDDNLWLNSELGLYCVQIKTGKSIHYTVDFKNPHSILPQNGLSDGRLFIDRQGVLWCSRFSRGISRLNLFESDFGLLKYETGEPVPDVLSALELKDGSFWIGTRNAGDALHRFGADGKLIKQYGRNAPVPSGKTTGTGLTNPFAGTLAVTADGSVWAGTGNPYRGSGGLNRIRPGTDQVTRFRFDTLDRHYKTAGANWITSVQVDGSGCLWFQNLDNDLFSMDPSTEIITPGIKNKLTGSLDTTKYIMELVTSAGDLVIMRKIKNTEFKQLSIDHTTHEVKSFGPSKVVGDSLRYQHEDQTGRIWFTTTRGFGCLGPDHKEVAYFFDYVQHGFYIEDKPGINSDKAGYVWLATSNGIFQFDPATDQFRRFGFERGLQGNSFTRLAYKGPSGRFYFNGYGGVNIFDPATIRINPYPPQMLFTGLKLDGKKITYGKRSAIHQPIYLADKITVGPEVDVISVDFAAIHFASNKGNQYQYKLEGFDKNWRDGETTGNATYTNLSAGKYTLYIKGCNWDNVWSDGTKSIVIRILPPWWQTWWAYTLYGLLFLFGMRRLYLYQKSRTIRKEREKARERELEQAKEIEKAYHELKATQQQLIQAEKMASLGELTAGIAHEIQNPLNFVNNFSEVNKELIEELKGIRRKAEGERNPLLEEELINDIGQNEEKIMHHGKRADAIVKSMLQHSRSSSGQKEPTDINALCDEYLRLAYHGLRAKDPSFNAEMRTDFDTSLEKVNIIPQDIGRVLLNLINNAFYACTPHPPKGGVLHPEKEHTPAVWVSTKKIGEKVFICVKDNGPGIPEEIIGKIFQPFFTTKPTGQGTGLGLSLSYDIVKAHGGEIKVMTKENEGTEFTIQLPLN